MKNGYISGGMGCLFFLFVNAVSIRDSHNEDIISNVGKIIP